MATCADCQREAPTGALFCAFCGAGLHAPGGADAAEALVGAALAGTYFLHELIGRGGMADVYRATDLSRDRTVVVKVLRRGAAPDAGAVKRFHREARAAARLSHPNTVALLDSGETETGTLFMVMELVPGATLAQLLAAGPLDAARAVGICAQILAALGEAHALGIIHRDLKPANVMVDPRDGTDRVKVLDFGIATVADGDVESRLTQQGTVFGTPAYMSPEQIRGEPLDPRSDLYAVGVILHESLAGRLPFEAETPLGLASRHLHDPPPPLSHAGVRAAPQLEALVLSALAKRREERPASAEAFRAALLACPVEATAAPAPQPRLPPTIALAPAEIAGAPRTTLPLPAPGRRPRAWTAGALVAVAVAAVAGWTALRDSRSVTPAVPAPTAQAPGVMAAAPGITATLPSTASAPQDPPPPPTAPAPRAASSVAKAPPRSTHASATTAVSTIAAKPPPIAATDVLPAAHPQAKTQPPPAQRPERQDEAPSRVPPRAPAIADASAPSPPPAIRAVRGELNSLPLPPAESGEGLLALEASPWAHITVNGRELGESPREVQLGAGTHHVRAVHPQLGAREAQVVVKPGQRTVWVAELE